MESSTSASTPEQAQAAGAAPNHVAVIMDGNGRWAAMHGKNRSYGHRAGSENLRRVIRAFGKRGVRYLTLYAFSTENWKRPDDEIKALLEILDDAIRNEVDGIHRDGVRLRHLGRLDRLSPKLRRAIARSVELTKNNSKMTVCVALDYGGRDEIVEAARSMIVDGVKPEDVSEELFQRYMYTNGMPDPDLIIRTSGEQRLSNFMIWQAAYAEYYFTPVYWPDFDEAEVAKAIEAYGRRRRRFGKA